MTELVIFTTTEGNRFYCTAEQSAVLEVLSNLHKGGIGTVYGYKPSTGYVTSPVQNMQIITRFSTARLYERKRAALNAITFKDVAEGIAKNPKLAEMSVADAEKLFNERKEMIVASLSKTLDGDRSDAHRQGHDRCYCHVTEGVKVNYDCVKDADGIMQPKEIDGIPVAESIMLSYLELSKETVTEGVYKTVNSGAPVLMTKCIEAVLNKRSVGFKTLSLKKDNFSHMKLSRTTITREDLLTEGENRDQYNAFLELLGLE